MSVTHSLGPVPYCTVLGECVLVGLAHLVDVYLVYVYSGGALVVLGVLGGLAHVDLVDVYLA